MPAQDVSGDNTMLVPASNAVAITPHATNELEFVTRGVLLGGSGNLSVFMAGQDPSTDTKVVLPNLAAGVIHPLRVRLIHTDSTATDIVAVW